MSFSQEPQNTHPLQQRFEEVWETVRASEADRFPCYADKRTIISGLIEADGERTYYIVTSAQERVPYTKDQTLRSMGAMVGAEKAVYIKENGGGVLQSSISAEDCLHLIANLFAASDNV
jgi:hypothetical protein